MKKGFLIFYLVLSFFVFFTGIYAVFSGQGNMAMRDGDIVYCRNVFTNCTEGACTASDKFIGSDCVLQNCKGDRGDVNVRCGSRPILDHNKSSREDQCDPVMSSIYGYCVRDPLSY